VNFLIRRRAIPIILRPPVRCDNVPFHTVTGPSRAACKLPGKAAPDGKTCRRAQYFLRDGMRVLQYNLSQDVTLPCTFSCAKCRRKQNRRSIQTPTRKVRLKPARHALGKLPDTPAGERCRASWNLPERVTSRF